LNSIDPKQNLEKIQIQTTSACNASCVFCPYVESWHYQNPGKMKLGLYKKILNDLEPFKNFETFCPYLMNEPLMDQRIFDWIKMFYDKYPEKTIELSFNPGRLGRKEIKAMKRVFSDRKHLLLLSFHGINKGSFEYIMDLPYEVCLRNTVNFLNECSNLRTIIKGAGLSFDGKIFYFGSSEYISFWNQVFKEFNIVADNISIQPFRFDDRAGQITRTERKANRNHYGVIRKIDSRHPFYCVRIDRVFHVLHNGDVALCCMDYKKEVPMGNIREISILDYYETPRYLEIRDMVLGKRDSPPNFLCKRCISPGG